MAPPAPVMAAICPASGGSFARPSLACSGGQYSHSNMSASLIDWNCPDRLGVGDDVRRPPRRCRRRCARQPCCGRGRYRPSPGTRMTRGSGIEHGPRLAEARVVALEVRLVAGDELLRRPPRAALEVVELAGLRRRHDQRPALGADGVIGRHHAGPGVARDLLAVDEIADGLAAAELQHQPPPRALDLAVGQAAGAAQDRRHLGQRRRSPAAAPPP